VLDKYAAIRRLFLSIKRSNKMCVLIFGESSFCYIQKNYIVAVRIFINFTGFPICILFVAPKMIVNLHLRIL